MRRKMGRERERERERESTYVRPVSAKLAIQSVEFSGVYV